MPSIYLGQYMGNIRYTPCPILAQRLIRTWYLSIHDDWDVFQVLRSDTNIDVSFLDVVWY